MPARSKSRATARGRKRSRKRAAVTAGVEAGLNTDLLPRIRGLLPSMNRAHRQIAEGLLADPEQFITRSISELATHCGISTASIVLFCKSLGLKGLPALKIALARELASRVLPTYAKVKGQRGAVSVLQRVFEENEQSLRETLRLNALTSLNAGVRVLEKAKRIVIFSIGLSYSVGYSLYIRLRFIGLPAFIEHDSHLQLAAAAETTSRDAAIGVSMSGTTAETVECLRISKGRGAKTICITNSIKSPLAGSADIRLYAAPSEIRYFQAPLASRVSQLALVDALVVALARHRKRKVLAHLERAEEHLLKRRLVNR